MPRHEIPVAYALDSGRPEAKPFIFVQAAVLPTSPYAFSFSQPLVMVDMPMSHHYTKALTLPEAEDFVAALQAEIIYSKRVQAALAKVEAEG